MQDVVQLAAQALETLLEGGVAISAEELAQSVADRFHPATYSNTERRVALPQVVVSALLGPDFTEEKAKLFVQAGTAIVDVMTHSVRMRRLHELSM